MTDKVHEVDIEAVARRVIAAPRRARVSTVEQVALCGRLLELFELHSKLMPAVSAVVARLDDQMVTRAAAGDVEMAAALKALKTLFETEFLPDGNDHPI